MRKVLGPETLEEGNLKRLWVRNFRPGDREWTSKGLSDGRSRVLVSRCALVRFAHICSSS